MKKLSKKLRSIHPLWRVLLRFFLYSVVIASLLLTSAIVVLEHYIPQDTLRPELERVFTQFLRRPTTIETLKWRFTPTPSLVAEHVRLWERDDIFMVYSPQINLYVDWAPLLERVISIREMLFKEPKVIFRRKAGEKINVHGVVSDVLEARRNRLLSGPKKKVRVELHRIRVKDGVFEFVDQLVQEEPLQTRLTVDALGVFEGVIGKKKFPFWLKAQVSHPKKEEGSLKLTGTLEKFPKVSLTADSIPVAVLADYVPFFSNLKGNMSFVGSISKTFKGLKWDARFDGNSLTPEEKGQWPEIDLAGNLRSHELNNLALNLKGKSTFASLEINDVDFKNRSLSAVFRSTFTDIPEIFKWWSQLQSFQQTAFWAPKRSTYTVESSSSFLEGWETTADFSMDQVRYRDEIFEDVTMKLKSTRENVVRFKPIRATGLGGRLSSNVVIYPKDVRKTAPEQDFRFWMKWDIDNVSMQRLTGLLKTPLVITGTGTTRGTLQGPFQWPFWRTMTGQIFVELNDGVIQGMPGLVQTLSTLNIASLLDREKRENKGDFPYQFARGTIKLKKGRAVIEEPGVLENKTMQLGLIGTVDFRKETVDGTVVLNFLSVFDEVVKLIPGVRTILLGDKKSIVPIWVKVTGKLQEPEVEVMQTKSVTRPFWNTIGRLFRLPEMAIDLFRDKK